MPAPSKSPGAPKTLAPRCLLNLLWNPRPLSCDAFSGALPDDGADQCAADTQPDCAESGCAACLGCVRHARLGRSCRRRNVLWRRRSSLQVVRRELLRLLRQRAVSPLEEQPASDPNPPDAAALERVHLVSHRRCIRRVGDARQHAPSTRRCRRSRSVTTPHPATSMPWLCYSCTARAGHGDPDSFYIMGPPSLYIRINGSSYTPGQQLPTMSIVPTGSAGSYSKSAAWLVSTAATCFALGGADPVFAPSSFNVVSQPQRR